MIDSRSLNEKLIHCCQPSSSSQEDQVTILKWQSSGENSIQSAEPINLSSQLFGQPVSISLGESPEMISKKVIDRILSDAAFLFVPNESLNFVFDTLLTTERAILLAKIAGEIKVAMNGDAFITLQVPEDFDPGFPELDFIVRQEHYSHDLLDILADLAQKYQQIWLNIATDYRKP